MKPYRKLFREELWKCIKNLWLCSGFWYWLSPWFPTKQVQALQFCGLYTVGWMLIPTLFWLYDRHKAKAC